MEGISKKIGIRSFISIYAISFFLNSTFFVNRNVSAAGSNNLTKIVAVFVDKDIYPNIESDVERYTSTYIQGNEANSKAVVFPVNIKTIKAFDITKILENMYFDGLKDEPSKLAGVVLIGDIPLPVIQENGFMYPSIYPYVDFEDQEFIYDQNKNFFVPNDNPNGQAEIRHGILNFDTTAQYHEYFLKLKAYSTDPEDFVAPKIWYDDFIGLKKYYVNENTNYYINKNIFSEDLGYHRVNNLLLNMLKSEHNNNILSIGDDLSADVAGSNSTELTAYAQMMKSKEIDAKNSMNQMADTKTPTLVLSKTIDELTKTYNGLISTKLLTQIRNNVEAAGRWYKQDASGKRIDDISSHYEKVVQQDNRLLGDTSSNLQPLLIQFNNEMESGINAKIENEKYYMSVPVPISYLNAKGDEKKGRCVRNTYDLYKNYYFGKDASTLKNIVETSTYRGTFQNLTSLTGVSTSAIDKSIGGSYKIVSTQVEANRGNNIFNAQKELQLYDTMKIPAEPIRGLKCTRYLFNRQRLNVCIKKRIRTANDSAVANKCNISDTSQQGGCETMDEFSTRLRGGASPLNINPATQELKSYDYKSARLPIFDIAGSKAVASAQANANNYTSIQTYPAMIQEKFSAGSLQTDNSLSTLIKYPWRNGNDLKFTNQLPGGNLEHPTWTQTIPGGYIDYFSTYNSMPSHTTNANQAILYTYTPFGCFTQGQIYTFKTLDSRVKNISPTPDQISDTQFYKFKNPSPLQNFYTDTITELSQIKTDILYQATVFSGTSSTDRTGVIANLQTIKNKITTYNNGIATVTTFTPATLNTYSSAQVTALANTWLQTNLTSAGNAELLNRISNTNTGLENLLTYLDTLSLEDVQSQFQNIITSEQLKNQQVEILTSWKSNIISNFNYITANVTTLKNTFNIAKTLYPTIPHINDPAALIAAQKTGISQLPTNCTNTSPYPCGCDANHYKALCDALDTIHAALTAYAGNLNDKLDKIAQYNGALDQNNNPILRKPFDEITTLFTPPAISSDITALQGTLNTFLTTDDTNKVEISKGMNITTADRPIDNIRNITFQGIGGDVVTFKYPDLYEVAVYKDIGNKQILKTPTEILTALKTYLQNKVTEYNTQLGTQSGKKTQYYQANANAFNLLATIDPQATPNRTYNLLDQNFFINQLVNSLDNLVTIYGKEYIYGDATPGTADDKLMLIAKILHQANSARPEKIKKTLVTDDIAQVQMNFNVNQRIAETTNTYLQSDNDAGAFLSPTYNQSGYEVGYINSDGADLVETTDTPAFIQQIQTIQNAKKETENTIQNSANTITQQGGASSTFENEIDTQCGGGSSLIFDLHTMKSPWLDAMKCRLQKTLKEPFKITVGFDNALGPTFAGSLKEIKDSFVSRGNEWKDFGASAAAADEAQNTNIFSTTSQTAKTKLREVMDFVEVKAPMTSWFVTSTGGKEITISTTRDIGSNQVKISATGDVCPGIGDGTTTFVQNLCQKTYIFNLTETKTLQLIPRNTKAGQSVITTKICLGNSSTCIQKSQTFEILPGPVAKIQINKATSILMAGAQMPITITAQDASDNALSQAIEQYTITPQTGTINGQSSMTFNNFSQANFIYQAPENISENMSVAMTVTGTNQDGIQISGTQSVIVAKGILNINYLNQIVYSTNTPVSKTMGYILPNSDTAFLKADADGITQVQFNNLPSLSLILQDSHGNKLDSILNITTRNGILIPGTVQQTTLDISGTNKTQYIFQAQNDFLIKDGVLNITLYPTTKAGKEELIINVPGLQPITLTFNIHPAAAQKVVLALDKNTLTAESGNNMTQVSLQVVDRRNNITDQSATIKLGVIGPGKINNQDTLNIFWTGTVTNSTLQASAIGGKGYLFGYIDGIALTDQVPGYQEFFVQKNVLPTENLNVMYLNLFGTDRGNQRGYFSDNDKLVNQLTEKSEKLLATTTQLIDPTKIKQIQVTIDPNGEVNNLSDNASELKIENGQIRNDIINIGSVALGNSSEFAIQIVTSTGKIQEREKNATTILYLPAPTDSIITENKISNKKLLINGSEVINFQNGTMDPGVQIIATSHKINGLTIYDIIFNDTSIGNIALYKNTHLITDANVTLQDIVKYAKEKTFTEGSTNGPMGIGIYDTQSVYTKGGYQSLEDSADPLLGIGFTSKFKNISYFADGQSVGNSTLPYGSVFLINFGDPLLKRVSESIKLSKTNLDGSIGQNIFSNPRKTILKTIPIDFDNDGLKDLLIAYTDGNIQLLKNYGGTNAYKNLQDLMILAEGIKDIQVGDVNDDDYSDIIIQTTNNQILVYRNKQGVIDVDGMPVCLNTNAEAGEITSIPNDLSQVPQFFIQDMDKDGNVDIVTSDTLGDIKIFYGGKDNHGNGNYLSTKTGLCDDSRYTRQQGNYQTLKRLGLKIRSDRLVTDESLVHRKNMQIPDTGTANTEDLDTAGSSAPAGYDKTSALNDAQSFVMNNDSYTATAAKDLAYVTNPTSKVPVYENSMTADQVMFLPIAKLSSEDKVSIYKQYTDLNGGTLKNNDQVQITTTILSLKYGNRFTYLDSLKGPRKIQKDTNNTISGLTITGMNASAIQIAMEAGSDYQFMIDNISLDSGESIQFSYPVTYEQSPLAKISVQDEDLYDQGKPLDTYPDIAISTSDPCLKTRLVLWNNHQSNQNYKKYIDVTDNIQDTITDYVSGMINTQQGQMTDSFQQISDTTDVSSTPGLSSILENRSIRNMFTNGGANINLNMNFIDSMTAGVSKKIDEGLKGLCQGFSLSKGGSCQGSPIPFNQAFLAPGDYHLFGCVPKAPNPLAPLFTLLNKTLGKGLPILSFPTATIPFVRPPIPAQAGGIFGGTTSQFRLYIAPTLTLGLGFALCLGPYSVGTKIPKPFRDLGGNCIVFAIPNMFSSCSSDSSANDTSDSKGGDEMDTDIFKGAEIGACTSPPTIGNTITFAQSSNTISTNAKGTSSPFQAVEVQGSVNNPMVPQGNFGGLIQIDQDPIIETNPPASTVAGQITQEPGYQLQAGPIINLKVLGAQTKGLIKCIIKDRFTRQIQYVVNNLTHMTIQVDLPDLSQLTQGMDKIAGLSESYKQLNAEDKAAGYIGTTTGSVWSQEGVLSQQRVRNQSELYGQNPFQTIAKMFKDVPLININTKDINVKVPALTSEDINKYYSYLNSWIIQNEKILEDRQSFLDELTRFCGGSGTVQKIQKYQELKTEELKLAGVEKLKKLSDADAAKLTQLRKDIQEAETCIQINNQDNFQKFITFKENSAQLIRSVKENIKVLDQYKQFPSQLYEWVHVSDRYFAELSSVTTDFVKSISFWLSTNANRFSKYVDAITLIIGAIKTRQAIIDFSVNRSEKCSKCSNDNYGSFSCSLSFLCPQLPIFKIPPFKIPDIHLDLSHLELGVDILLPKFNFVPVKIPLPQLPNLPEPPTVEINRDILYNLNLNLFKDMLMPTVPVIPSPPQLPELPSFIPDVKLQLPVLPPAPQIPKILPEINGTLKVADFIGKVFCIVKGGIGLVGEKGVKAKIEQITQRTWNVPIFDYFDLTTTFKDPPLEGFEYKIDAYARLKYNFEGVYAVMDNLAQAANQVVSKNIEAPIQQGIEIATSGANNNPAVQNLENIPNININGYLPSSGDMNYTTAYHELNEGLLTFQKAAAQDKKLLSKIDDIFWTINADSTIAPATKELKSAKAQADGIIAEKKKEVDEIQKQIKEYDTFINTLEKNKIQLVKQDDLTTTISSPLIKGNTSTQQLINSQENPDTTYLALNKSLVQGYSEALNASTPEALNMTTDTYTKSQKLLANLNQQIASTSQRSSSSSFKLQALSQSPQARLADCPNCEGNAVPQNGYQQDISAYVQGIFIQTGSGTGKTMINVVNNTAIANQVAKNHTQEDMNNDKQDDILMWDANNIYLKYGNQNSEHTSKAGNHLTRFFTKYYLYPSNGGKRWIDSIDDLISASTKGYLDIKDITLKVCDQHQEVKNLKTQGQSFDTLQLGWKNSISIGDDINGYVIKFTHKIDNFFDKVQTFSFFGNLTTDTTYILVLPNDTAYSTGILRVENVNKKITSLMTGTVLAVKYFDPNQEDINIIINELPRKWSYAQIATLDQKTNIYTTSSPRSNQIVAGNQTLSDAEPPSGEITLHRIQTNEDISTGNTHQGYINTTYALNVLRTDNIAVTTMNIEKDGQLIAVKTGTNSTGAMSITPLFFTGATGLTYIFSAMDANGNIDRQEVNLAIDIPKIEVTSVNQLDKNTAQIIANLEHDLDEGLVTFQRVRNSMVKDITGTNSNTYGGYSLHPGQTIITGGVFTFGNTLGLYSPAGDEIGSIDPDNGEIMINDAWKNKISLKLDFLFHIPTIKVVDSTTNKELFQITYPAQKLGTIKLLQGKPNYESVELTEPQFQEFQGGTCIKNTNNECVLYINTKGTIYAPGIYTSLLGGTYSFDAKNKTVIYTVTDESNHPIASISILIQPLIQ